MSTLPPPPPGAPTEAPYPPPPSEPAAKKSSKLKWLLIIGAVVVALIVIAAIAGSGSKDDDVDNAAVKGANATEATEEATPTTEADKGSSAAENGIGDTDDTSDWEVTVNSVTNPYVPSSSLFAADPGKHYIAADISMKNTGGKQETVSTILMMELRDSEGFQHFEDIVVGSELPKLGGTVDPDGVARGWVFFEVPDTATGLVLRVKGDLTATGTTFQIG